MADVSYSYLIPIAELTPGGVSSIRNKLRDFLVEETAARLSMAKANLVVRDIRAYEDMVICKTTSAVATENDWKYTGTSAAWEYWTDEAQTMADQRFIILYGLRDLTMRNTAYEAVNAVQAISLVKIEVGNAVKAIWDSNTVGAYALSGPAVAVTSNGVLIPQNAAYQLSVFVNSAVAQWLQLVGLVCEPRGKLISP